MKDSNILQSAILGTIAFNNGLSRVPCCDKDLMNLLSESSNKIGDSLPLMGKRYPQGIYPDKVANQERVFLKEALLCRALFPQQKIQVQPQGKLLQGKNQ